MFRSESLERSVIKRGFLTGGKKCSGAVDSADPCGAFLCDHAACGCEQSAGSDRLGVEQALLALHVDQRVLRGQAAAELERGRYVELESAAHAEHDHCVGAAAAVEREHAAGSDLDRAVDVDDVEASRLSCGDGECVERAHVDAAMGLRRG